jgi:hypothetical protein
MPCYVIQAGDSGFVKIGWADDPDHRLADLQCGNHETLTIIRLIEGTPATERWLHRKFAAHRGIREWFRLVPEMLTIEPIRLVSNLHWHADVIQAFGSIRQLAEAIGVDPPRAIHWAKRGIPAKYWPAIEASAIGRERGFTAIDLSLEAA